MDVVGVVVLGILFFFGVVLLTLLMGALGRKDERDILRRNARDVASDEGGMTLPPSPTGRFHDNPV
jgi:hypothetical protein